MIEEVSIPSHRLANNMMIKMIYGMSKQEALSAGLCLNCKRYASSRCFTAEGHKDYQIHGVCEQCVAVMFDQKVPTGICPECHGACYKKALFCSDVCRLKGDARLAAMAKGGEGDGEIHVDAPQASE